MKLLITGANGYIGQRLVRLLMTQQYQIVVASRNPPQLLGDIRHSASRENTVRDLVAAVSWLPFDLLAVDDIVLSEDINVVIHLAAITSSKQANPHAEINAAKRLIAATQRIHARFIFVSSQVANINAPSDYGRVKAAIERLTTETHGWIVRPGLVYGGYERGLFGTLANIIRKIAVYPAFIPAPKVQPIHVDDLAQTILACATSPITKDRLVHAGDINPISFTKFLNLIASNWARKPRLSVPVPTALVSLLSRGLGGRLSNKLGLLRLHSLFTMPTMDTEADLKRLGITLRSLEAGLSRTRPVNRRALNKEGYALLAYVMRSPPNISLTKRYVRAIEQLRAAEPIGLPNFFLQLPSSIALLENSSKNTKEQKQELEWRLNISISIAEASKRGAYLLIGPPTGNRIGLKVFHIALAVLSEISWRLLGIFVRPSLRHSETLDRKTI
jgi:nucleoside-diphosphate-sugar epimerase